jgi:hypothetical protein
MWLAVALLFAWRLQRRIRRLVGRQQLSKVRPWLSALLFPVLILLLLMGALARPMVAAELLGGVAIGVGLAVYSLKRTRFEVTPIGLYYTPNAHVGIALSVLFAARIVYRLLQVGEVGLVRGNPASAMAFAGSPLTLAIFGMLAGYYAAYAVGLLRWRAGVERAPGA